MALNLNKEDEVWIALVAGTDYFVGHTGDHIACEECRVVALLRRGRAVYLKRLDILTEKANV